MDGVAQWVSDPYTWFLVSGVVFGTLLTAWSTKTTRELDDARKRQTALENQMKESRRIANAHELSDLRDHLRIVGKERGIIGVAERTEEETRNYIRMMDDLMGPLSPYRVEPLSTLRVTLDDSAIAHIEQQGEIVWTCWGVWNELREDAAAGEGEQA